MFIKCLTITKGKKMAREDWYYPNLEMGLIKEVDDVVYHVMWHGSPKYKDRRDFIVKAIKRLLDIELNHKEECCK